MEKNIKGINVSAPVVPYTDNDVYPTHKAIYGKGGWKSVRTIEELKAIPSERLEDGCIVRVVETKNGSSAEFYYDSKIIRGTSAPSSIKDPIEQEVYPYCFRKWAPGYLPTKVSDLENDKYFISEVYGEKDGKYVYLNPFPENGDKDELEDILKNRPRGIYQELALSFLYKNTHTALSLDTNGDNVINGSDGKVNIHGIVTVDETGKIPNKLLEYPGKYVESLEAFFPDDYCEFPSDPAAWFVMINGKPSRTDKQGNPVTDDTEGAMQSEAIKLHYPKVTEKDQKYYVTEYYRYGDNEAGSNACRNKVAIITSSGKENISSWVTGDPILNDIIYINKHRRTAFIIENEGLIVEKSIGRDLIKSIEDLKFPSNIENTPTEWDHWGISAKVAYQILLEMDKIVAWGDDISDETNKRREEDAKISARIDKLVDKLNAHMQNKDNPHEVTRKQLGVDVDDEVTFSKVYSKSFFMSNSLRRFTPSSKETISSEQVVNQRENSQLFTTSPSLDLDKVEYTSTINNLLRTKRSIGLRGSRGGYEWEERLNAERLEREEADRKLNARLDELEAAINAHIARKDNPHETNRRHLKIGPTDSVDFLKVNASGGFYEKPGVAAVFMVEEEEDEASPVDIKLFTLEEKLKALESELEAFKKK